MAIIENGYLRGQIGNLVNRKLGNKNVVQTKSSEKIRQTEWTKAAGSDFGKASSAGSLIRRSFLSAHLQMHDSEMHNRLVKCMNRVLRGNGTSNQGYTSIREGNINRLIDFQFNENCHVYDYVYFDPIVSFDDVGNANIILPPLAGDNNFLWPKNCSQLITRIEVVGLRFDFQRYSQTIGVHELELYRSSKIEDQVLCFDVNETDYEFMLVSLSVLYLSTKGNYSFLLNSKELNPVGIIAAHMVR